MSLVIDKKTSWWTRRKHRQHQDCRERQELLALMFLKFAAAFDLHCEDDGRLSSRSSNGKLIVDDPMLGDILIEYFEIIQRLCPEVYKRWESRMQMLKG